jgi:hypothetical protein
LLTTHELQLLAKLERRDADPRTRGRFANRLRDWPHADADVPTTNTNRGRFIGELHRKLQSPWRPESSRVAQAEAQMASNRLAAKDELLRRSRAGQDADAHPTKATSPSIFGMIADKAEQANNARREHAERRAYRAEAAAREQRRQHLPVAPSEGQIAERALAKIARTNLNI